MNLARQKTCKTLLHLKQSLSPICRADLGIGAPIWVRDRLEAFAVAALWRNKLSYVIGVNSG